MSDSMGKAVYDAAENGNEAELTRLIGLGGNVNWRNWVRRRMCLAWAPASSPPLLLSPPRSPETAPVPTARCTARGRAAAELGTRVLVAWRAPHPRVLAHAPRVLWHSMTPRVLHLPQVGYTGLIMATVNGHEGCVRLLLEAEAIEVNATVSLEHALPQHMRWVRLHVVIPLLASRLSLEQPRARRVGPPPPRGRGDQGQRQGGKPRACPPPAHAMGPLPCSHSVWSLVCL